MCVEGGHSCHRLNPYVCCFERVPQSPEACSQNSTNVDLEEHRSFLTLEGGMSAASFLHSVSSLFCPYSGLKASIYQWNT